MATSKSKATGGAKVEPKKRDPNTLQIKATQDDMEDELARVATSPCEMGAMTMQAYKKHLGEVDLMGLIKATNDQIQAVHSGDMKRTEAMLITQAHTLDAIFNELARRAIGADIMPKLDTYLRLGLKAQSQCRATLETLAEIKNPKPTAFIRQQNVGVNQQVNNDAALPAHGKTINQPNELLEDHHGKRMDTGTTGAAIGANQELEAVGAIHRGQDI